MHADSLKLARRAYETGRGKIALLRASVAAALAAVVALATLGRQGLPWVGAAFVVLFVTEYRGLFLAKGARRGLFAGLVTLVLPMSILRPCCAAGMKMAADGSCCTEPSACLAAGAVVGLALALAWPRSATKASHHIETGIGTALGVVSVAAVRCSGMFYAESLGLLAGLAFGITASVVARSLSPRPA